VGRGQLVLVDAAIPIVVGGVVAVGIVFRADPSGRPLALALGLAASVVLVARRRAPVATLVASGGLVLGLFAVDSAAGAAAVFAPAVALFSLALTRARVYQVIAGLGAVAAVVAADVFLAGGHDVTMQTVGHVALVAVPLLAAEALRSRRSYVSLLLEQLEVARQAREAEARRRVEQERLRIARDLHDVVAHTLTTINVQAGVASHLLKPDASHATRALATIEEASRDALAELRAMVGVLRTSDAEEAPLEPAPTIDTVCELIERARRDGIDVGFDVSGQRPVRLPDAVQLAAFRIVQESLTNIHRHASGAPASVRLSYEPDRLRVTIENTAGAKRNGGGIGVGIIGMKERAAAVGGTLEAVGSEDGFRVAAELPYSRET